MRFTPITGNNAHMCLTYSSISRTSIIQSWQRWTGVEKIYGGRPIGISEMSFFYELKYIGKNINRSTLRGANGDFKSCVGEIEAAAPRESALAGRNSFTDGRYETLTTDPSDQHTQGDSPQHQN